MQKGILLALLLVASSLPSHATSVAAVSWQEFVSDLELVCLVRVVSARDLYHMPPNQPEAPGAEKIEKGMLESLLTVDRSFGGNCPSPMFVRFNPTPRGVGYGIPDFSKIGSQWYLFITKDNLLRQSGSSEYGRLSVKWRLVPDPYSSWEVKWLLHPPDAVGRIITASSLDNISGIPEDLARRVNFEIDSDIMGRGEYAGRVVYSSSLERWLNDMFSERRKAAN